MGIIYACIWMLACVAHYVTGLTQDQIDECVATHNALRALHPGTPPMTWDEGLAKDAQKWADHLADINSMVHAHGIDQGENLFYLGYFGKKVPVSCADATHAWYMEYLDYDHKTGESINGKAVGHYTQVVWKKSTKVGVGMATTKVGKWTYIYVVARYKPRGNFVMMKYGESFPAAKARVYQDQVVPAKAGSTVPSIPDLRKLGRKRSVTGLNFHASMNFKRSAVGSEDNVFVAEATSDDVTEKRSMEEKLAALDKPTSYDVSKRAEKGDKSDEATYSDLTSFWFRAN